MPSSPSPILSSPCTQRSTARVATRCNRVLWVPPDFPCAHCHVRASAHGHSQRPPPVRTLAQTSAYSHAQTQIVAAEYAFAMGTAEAVGNFDLNLKGCPLVRADYQFGIILRTKGGVSVTWSNVEPSFVDCTAPSTHAPWHCIYGPTSRLPLALWLLARLGPGVRAWAAALPVQCHTGFRYH